MQSNNLKSLRQPEVLFKNYLEKFPSLGIYWYEQDGRAQSDKEWTKRNLDYFYQMGSDKGFDCWSSQHGGEYHVDLCWYRGYPQGEAEEKPEDWGKQKHFMELALEHELGWKASSIYYAFSKLVDVKAYLKVFMCLPRVIVRPKLAEALSRVVSTSSIRVPVEAYLLIIFSHDQTREPSEALHIEGFTIDYRGAVTSLGGGFFPDASH